MKKSCSLNLDNNLNKKTSIKVYSWSSTQAISVKTYEFRTSRSNFHPMLKYLYRVSFLTILDIYKAYFKSRRACRKWSSSLFSLKKLLRVYAKSLWPKSFMIFIVDELNNFAANNLFKLLELVMYWDPCIIG